MGVTLTANNSRISFNTSYGGFLNLRRNIASCMSETFGELYCELLTNPNGYDYTELSKKVEGFINKETEWETECPEVLDFLFASDCGGKAGYKTCGKLYEIIKDRDFGNKGFQYSIITMSAGRNDYDMLKEFLRDCHRYHRTMQWY